MRSDAISRPRSFGWPFSFGGRWRDLRGGGGNEGTKFWNQWGLVREISLYDETMMRINPKGLRRQLDLKVPERPLQLRVSSPDRKEKESAMIMYRENTTITETTSFITRYMASMQGHARCRSEFERSCRQG